MIHHQAVLHPRVPTTNNKDEYEVVITDLKMVTTLEITEVEVQCDSLLIMSQIKGNTQPKMIGWPRT